MTARELCAKIQALFLSGLTCPSIHCSPKKYFITAIASQNERFESSSRNSAGKLAIVVNRYMSPIGATFPICDQLIEEPSDQVFQTLGTCRGFSGPPSAWPLGWKGEVL